jgi:UDP-N-acetylmuramyl pentapeptide phosphotransferase/UDP-N-acetylglucosamine-1-phosphate transferase
LALLFIPLYDTVRVTIIRIWEGRSPFRADKQHIHHVLVAMGYNHLQATSILISVNALMIVMATLLNGWGNMVLMLLILFAGIIFSFIIYLLSRNRPIENTY